MAKNKSEEKALICSDIKKTYIDGSTQVHALRGISFDVKMGELLIVAGPSGCGKTTLISIIAGILNPDKGSQCSVFGHEITQMSKAERIAFRAKNIGFVFQAFNLIPALTTAENVAVPLIINGQDRNEAVADANQLLSRMGMEDKAKSLPASLSGGQQQRVAIARALIHKPSLIVCDEPTSALDGETGQKILSLMKHIVMNHNRSLIVVTHDSRIFHYADRIVLMEDGKIKRITSDYRELH